MINRLIGISKKSIFVLLITLLTQNIGVLLAAEVCDVDGNNAVEQQDIDLIFQARNRMAISPFDPMDIDRNGTINTDDARQCVCALPTTAACEPPLNRTPVANAGQDQTLTQVNFSVINLDGSASNDPDGDALSYNWAFQQTPDNSQSVLQNKSSVTPSFVPDQFGVYVIELTVTDGFDASNTSLVTITIQASQSSLQAIADAFQTASGQSISGNLVSNDIAGVGNTLISNSSQNGQNINLGAVFTTNAGGSFLIQADGSFTYTPPLVENNQLQEVFAYTITDDTNATSNSSLTITVDSVTPPQPPSVDFLAVPDTNSVIGGGLSVSGNVLSNDQFEGQQPRVTALPRFTQPRGTFSLSANGSYTYRPPAIVSSRFVERFGYNISRENGQSSNSRLIITVEMSPVIEPLVARRDENVAVAAGAAIAGNVLLNDDLGNQPVNVAPVRTNFRTAYGGLLTLQRNGSYTYLPAQSLDMPVLEEFNYTITDFDGQQSSSFLAILVIPENRSPLANPDIENVDTGGMSISGNVLVNDDLGNQPTTVTPVLTNSSTSLGGILSLQANGDFNYTSPQSLQIDGQQEVIDYTITDADGETSSSTLTITVNIGNQLPEAIADQNTAIAGGSAVTGNVLANDQLGDQPTQLTGAVANFQTDQGGLFTLLADGNYTYLPPSALTGVINEQFNYTITDSDGDASSSTLTIMVSRLEILPMANPDINTATASGVPATGNVLDNDNPGNEPTLVTPVSSIDPSIGDSFSLIANGEYSYMPPTTVTGVMTRVFNYTITDSDGQLSSSTVTITVNPEPVMLTCNPDQFEVTAGDNPLLENVLTNDVTTGRPVQVTPVFIQNTDNGGTFSLQADGDFVYTPAASVPGVATDIFSYIVTNTENSNESCNSTVTITVNQENLIPLARPDQDTVVAGNNAITGNVLTNDDLGNPTTIVTPLSIGQTQIGGSLTLNNDGSYAYTPPSSVQGVITDSFDYTITDDDGESSQSTLTITVSPLNLIPFARPDTDSVKARDGSNGVQGNVLDNDDQGNLPTLVTPIVNFGTTNQGFLNIDEDGNYSYLPPSALAGIITEIFNYTITDNDGETSESTLSVTLTPTCRAQNDANSVVAGASGGFLSVIIRNRTAGNVLDNDLFCTDVSSVTLVSETTPLGGTITIQTDGSYLYLAPSFVASEQQDSIAYIVTDAEGDMSNGILNITVFPDLSPTANEDSNTADAGGVAVNGDVLLNDELGNEPTSVALVGSNLGTLGGMLDLQSDGTYTYTPPISGSFSIDFEVFNYRITDVDGDTSVSTLTIAVTGI